MATSTMLICLLLATVLTLCNKAVGGLTYRQGTPAEDIFDYIIVGCGAAGLLVAQRLSEDPSVRVLCLEAGTFDQNEDFIVYPIYIGEQPPCAYDWCLSTISQTQLDNNPRRVPMGRGVGGGTLINGMLWNRGNAADFDTWAQLGNAGWTWQDLLPYFNKSETFTPACYGTELAAPTTTTFLPADHGFWGPVNVSYPSYLWPQSNDFFEALAALGIPTIPDPNAGQTAGAFMIPSSLNPVNQTRSTARNAHYDTFCSRTNFLVQQNSMVTQILFGGRNSADLSVPIATATGVTFASGPGAPIQTILARREIILAAGALHTPQLLQLSGIGSSSLLSNLNITIIEDFPGVGNNFQDHCMIHMNYTYEALGLEDPQTVLENPAYNQTAVQQFFVSRTGPWAGRPSSAVAFPALRHITNATFVTSLLRSAFESVPLVPSTYETTLLDGYQQQKSSLLSRLSDITTPVIEILNNNAGNLDLALMHPLSRGTVQITSSDPFTPPAIDPRWLSDPLDRQTMLLAMSFNERILSQPAIQLLHPTYSANVPRNANISTFNSILNAGASTEYHYAGTAAMLPRSLGGVVDSTLTVYGTSNLRVVDTSIFPLIPGAHLQSVAYAVAEKAADLIKGRAWDWRVDGAVAQGVPNRAFYNWVDKCELGSGRGRE